MPPAINNNNYSDVIVVEDFNNTVRSNSVNSLSSTIDAQYNKNSRYQFSLVQDNDNNIASHFKLNLPSNYKPTTNEIAIQKVLSSIIILNSPTSPQVSTLLSKYNGKLLSIGTSILQGLYHAAPVNNDSSSSGGFTGRARVGDYNENLFYHMELKDMNLIDIIQNNSSTVCSPPRSTDQQQEGVLQSEIKSFETTLRNTLNQQAISYRGSFMSTEQTMYQPAHVDYDYSILSKYGKRLYLAFFPLTLDGAYLQLWQKTELDEGIDNAKRDDKRHQQRDEVEGTVVYIPYGQILLLPSDTIHGGGFKRGKGGNLRFHLYIALDDEDSGKEDEGEGEKKKEINLLDHPMNKYTEEHDRRRELCERYVNAPGLDSLLGVFFDDGVSCNEDEEESPIPVNREEPVVESTRDDIEAVQKLANAVKGVKLPGTKSLDSMKVGSIGSKRNSASYVNLYGLTDEEEFV